MPRVEVGSADGVVLEVTVDEGSGPVAVLGHGAGSTPDFVRACLAAPLQERGWRVATWDMRGHGPLAIDDPALLTIDRFAADLGAVADAVGASHVGGISLGAHSAATWALTQPPGRVEGLLLVCPAWTGEPDAVADLNRLQAEQLETLGLAATLDLVDAGAPPWMAGEVRTWFHHHDLRSLCLLLRTLAAQPAPSLEALEGLDVRAGMAVLLDDGLHPAVVGQAWADALPRGAWSATTITEIGVDRSELGRALVRAWDLAG